MTILLQYLVECNTYLDLILLILISLNTGENCVEAVVVQCVAGHLEEVGHGPVESHPEWFNQLQKKIIILQLWELLVSTS